MLRAANSPATIATASRFRARRKTPLRALLLPPPGELMLSLSSAALLILSFPDFNWWPLAWVALVPLLLAATRARRLTHAFICGWAMGTVFFYGSCYWLTYSMIRYGGLPSWLAYLLLLPGAAIVGAFPGFFAAALNFLFCRRRQAEWTLAAPVLWTAFEFARLSITGQLWNAVGYSQAYVPDLIQLARLGGVYAVGFAVVSVNAALAYAWLARRSRRALVVSAAVIVAVAVVIVALLSSPPSETGVEAVVIGVQANVPMNFDRSPAQNQALLERHLLLSEQALASAARDYAPRVVVWSESPMNFAYTRDAAFRSVVIDFAQRHRTAVVFNSLEPAAAGGSYNSAIMIDERGRLLMQYDKIRLLPFGEYVPLPKWLPGAGLASAIVGDFTPGAKYPLLPAGSVRSGVFICFESAFPDVAREFARQGADVLINISNDGYFGPTPVLRQHLANVVFRAVETNRPVLRITNTGLTAYIGPRGDVRDVTAAFQTATRVWPVARATTDPTFYTKFGDVFAYSCLGASALLLLLLVVKVRRGTAPI